MKRRNFLTTSSGALCFSHLVRAEEHSFKGKIKKAVKFGTKPNEKQMQKLKDLGFDGIEGSGPGLQIEPMKMACSKFKLPMHGMVYNKHWKVRLSDPSSKVREESRQGLAQAMREAKGVGGTSVLLVPGRVKGDQETHQHVWDRSIAQIQKPYGMGFVTNQSSFVIISMPLTVLGCRRIMILEICRNMDPVTSGSEY